MEDGGVNKMGIASGRGDLRQMDQCMIGHRGERLLRGEKVEGNYNPMFSMVHDILCICWGLVSNRFNLRQPLERQLDRVTKQLFCEFYPIKLDQ